MRLFAGRVVGIGVGIGAALDAWRDVSCDAVLDAGRDVSCDAVLEGGASALRWMLEGWWGVE